MNKVGINMMEEPVILMDKDPNQPNVKLKHSSDLSVNHKSHVRIKEEPNIKDEPLNEKDMEVNESCDNLGLHVREEENITGKSEHNSRKTRHDTTSTKTQSTGSPRKKRRVKVHLNTDAEVQAELDAPPDSEEEEKRLDAGESVLERAEEVEAKGKRTCKVLTQQQRIEVIQRCEKGEKKAEIEKAFGVSKSTIRNILRNKAKIMATSQMYGAASPKAGPGKQISQIPVGLMIPHDLGDSLAISDQGNLDVTENHLVLQNEREGVSITGNMSPNEDDDQPSVYAVTDDGESLSPPPSKPNVPMNPIDFVRTLSNKSHPRAEKLIDETLVSMKEAWDAERDLYKVQKEYFMIKLKKLKGSK